VLAALEAAALGDAEPEVRARAAALVAPRLEEKGAWAPLARVLEAEIDARRRAGQLGEDLIGAVLRDEPGVPADAIVDELLVVLMAAQEPPSIALTWLLDRVARGIGMGEDTVRETLRLWPPAFAMLRRLTAPREVAGRLLPAGITVVLPTPLLHRDPRAFADPDAFRPERWAAGPDERSYAPFGGGARRCVGEQLAQLYVEVLLPAVAESAGLAPVTEEPAPMVLRGTVLVPRDGGRVRRA
jgi:cytochrome P450